MKSIEEIFDSESLRIRAWDLIKELNIDELNQWKQHPCTQHLLLILKGDFLDFHESWQNGVFTSEGAEGTVQLNSKAIGALEAIRLVVSHIEEISIHDQDGGI